MKRYWDSSALLDAFWDTRIEKMTQEPDQWTRPFTGGRLGAQFLAADAAAIIRELTAAMNFVQLEPREILTALDEAEQRGVRGGNVHDWMHARAAKKAGVEVLLTDNFSDFQSLADGFRIQPP